MIDNIICFQDININDQLCCTQEVVPQMWGNEHWDSSQLQLSISHFYGWSFQNDHKEASSISFWLIKPAVDSLGCTATFYQVWVWQFVDIHIVSPIVLGKWQCSTGTLSVLILFKDTSTQMFQTPISALYVGAYQLSRGRYQ